ncbi:MAG TPA: carboxypeptidase-like regulatory domain-containing protein [Pyrinomonadaceae bacterium]|nr:carboxypeptidase-like regulatory domain-containing protein [Pyrinomonadaceae bacterium]
MISPARPRPPSHVGRSFVAPARKSLLLFFCLLFCSWSMARAQDEPQRIAADARAGSQRDNSITGRVTGEDGRPLSDVSVNVYALYSRAPGSPQTDSTDGEGRFRVTGLSPGIYVVQASLPGYVLSPGGLTDGSTPQYYRPGDAANLTLVKGGVITGTVRDSGGEPVIAIGVRAFRVRDASGRSIARVPGYAQPRMTDDRGIYRLYGLQPGTYLISTGGALGFYSALSAFEGEAPTYYPSSTRDTAAEVTVRSGEEMTNIDIRYRGERGHTVSGQVSGSVDSAMRFGVSIILKQALTAGVEATTFSPPGDKQSFSFSGVADGEYELVAQQGIGGGESTASIPRRITVKGADVTGVGLALAPLASIAGRFNLEPVSKETCAAKGNARLTETLVMARRDEAVQSKESPPIPFFSAGGGVANEQGEFSIRNLIAGSYRLEPRLPGDLWYARSMVIPGQSAAAARPSGAKTQPAEAKTATPLPIVTLKASEKLSGVVVQVSQEGATLRGRIAAQADDAAPPANLKIFLVPAERERAEDVLRYGEATLAGDGSFTFQNLAPGRYWLLARTAPEESPERAQRPLAWDATERAKLRREAEAANSTVELQPCQRPSDYSLRYATGK